MIAFVQKQIAISLMTFSKYSTEFEILFVFNAGMNYPTYLKQIKSSVSNL